MSAGKVFKMAANMPWKTCAVLSSLHSFRSKLLLSSLGSFHRSVLRLPSGSQPRPPGDADQPLAWSCLCKVVPSALGPDTKDRVRDPHLPARRGAEVLLALAQRARCTQGMLPSGSRARPAAARWEEGNCSVESFACCAGFGSAFLRPA